MNPKSKMLQQRAECRTSVEDCCSFCPTLPGLPCHPVASPVSLSPPLSPCRFPCHFARPPLSTYWFPCRPVGSLVFSHVSLSYIHELEFVFRWVNLFSCHHWQRELFIALHCVRSLSRVYFIVKSMAFNPKPSAHSVAVRRILISPHEELLGWWKIICTQPAFSCQLWSKLCVKMPLTRSRSRKSVESSQGSDEMEVSSQDYLFDSPWSEEDKTVIKDYIQYHREWMPPWPCQSVRIRTYFIWTFVMFIALKAINIIQAKGLWRCRSVPNKVLRCWKVDFFSKHYSSRL